MKKLRVISKFLKHYGLVLIPITLFAWLTELFTQPGAVLTGWFWLSVVVNMFAGLVIIFAAWWLAGRFIHRVYELGGAGEGIRWLMRRRFGKWAFRPVMILSQGKVVMDTFGLLSRGGPGTMIVHNDTAVVLEKGGRLTRVKGSGFPALEPFEKIYDIIDLRPKNWHLPVEAMTKEGIPITWDVEIQYQINDGGQEPTAKAPYPFVKEDVFRAATGKWRRERGRLQEMDWEGWIVISQTEGALRSILARRRLDELIGLTEAERVAAREDIQAKLEETLHQAAPKIGAKILEIKLGNLKVDDEVTQQWIENWRSRWHSWSTNQLAREEAERIEAYEMADAKSLLMPLDLMTKEVQELADSGQDINTIISMRLVSALAQARMENEIFAPNEALDTLKKFRELLDGGANSSQPPFEVESDVPPPPPKMPPLRKFPLLGAVPAGHETPATDEILGEILQTGETEFEFEGKHLTVKRVFKGSQLKFAREYQYVVVPVSGDSMDRAGLTSGDYAILRTPHLLPLPPASGDIVAVVFQDKDDNTATLKRIHFDADTVVLQPESSNPEHQPRVLQKDAFAGENPYVEIAGIVIAVLERKNGE